MAKKMKPLDWLNWIVALIVTLGVGGLFIAGTFMTTFLSFLGSTIHAVVGWIIVIQAALSAISKFM